MRKSAFPTPVQRLLLLGRGDAAPVWTPALLPDLAAHFDATAMTGLSDGDPVALWRDLSGHGRDATQATTAARPAYSTAGIGGRPSVRFDGADDFLFLGDLSDLVPAAATLIVVASFGQASLHQNCYVSQYGLQNYWQYAGVSYNRVFNAAEYTFPSTPGIGEHCIVCQSDAALWSWSVDGVVEATRAGNYLAGTDHRLGSCDGLDLGTQFLDGDLGEVILLSTTSVAPADWASLRAYLLAKWGVNL
jgi:hypothetical protein